MGCTEHKKEITKLLKDGGLKITFGRLGLLDIFKHSKRPLTVKEIAKLYKNIGKIDLATLYRNMESLEETDIIKKVRIADNEIHYELPSLHHHHLVCTRCNKIADVQICLNNKLIPKDVVKKLGFKKITSHSLEFFGLCKKCSK